MRRCIIFVLLCIAMVSLVSPQEKTVIPLHTIRDKSHVTIKIGNIVIHDILLDTGFSFDGLMIYNPDYKDSLNLSNAMDVSIGGAGSGEAARASMIVAANFSIGEMKMINQRIIMLEDDMYKGFPSNGIIGYSIFGHYITEFNYDENTLTLHHTDNIKIDTSWSIIPLYFKDNNIPWMDVSVEIELESPTLLSAYIDYAAGDAILLLEKPTMKFKLPRQTENVYIGRGLSGDIYGKTGTISKLIIGPYEMKNVKASFAPAEVRSKQKNADAILGIGSLKRFNLIFDYSKKKLYLKPNKHFDDPFY